MQSAYYLFEKLLTILHKRIFDKKEIGSDKEKFNKWADLWVASFLKIFKEENFLIIKGMIT